MSSPSKPVAIKSPRLAAAEIAQSTHDSVSATPVVGTPNLQALRNQYAGTPPVPNVPPRVLAQKGASPSLNFPGSGTPSSYRQSIGGISASASKTPVLIPSASGTATPNVVDLDGLPDEEKAKVLARHLVSKVERQNANDSSSELNVPGPSSTSRRSSSGQNTAVPVERDPSEPFPIPYDAPGADVTHDIYKWHADKTTGFRTRVRSVSYAGASRPQIDPAFEHIHEPGGFRRNYLLLRANEQGTDEPPRIINNFIDFLFLYGHFAGEDLEDEDDKEDGIPEEDEEGEEPTEETPLFLNRRSRSRSQVRSSSQATQGTASVTGAVMMLLKSFIGTGVLFLGKAFYNGGLLFSSITFVAIAAISLYSFLLLTKAKFVVPGSFGDIGGALYGPWFRYVILTSIVVSQIGFCSAYTIFVAENLEAFVQSVTHCMTQIPSQYFILIQLVVFLPLALVRNLGKLSITILIADAFIFAGLVYIFGSEIAIVSKRGIADVQMFNPRDFSLFIGTAVFSFEGIGLVIPITDAMKEPHKFPLALSGVMFFLTILFGGAGALAYMTFGSEVQTVVLVNLDTKSPMVQAVQFLYSMAILLSVPLQFFPAVRILENGLFTKSGKANPKVKWYKNFFRFFMVMVSTAIAWFGSADLDKFVAFIGCFACVPLCYIYPAMLHYKACAHTRGKKLADIAMIVFGGIVAVYTTIQTVKLMIEPAPAGPPVFVCES